MTFALLVVPILDAQGDDMENKETELVFILDKSGSMMGLEKDTIVGFNSLLKKQKSEKGDAVVTTVLFDHRYSLLHDRLPIRGVTSLSAKEYVPSGTTALLDAVGRTIDSLLERLYAQKTEEKPSVLFVIITDGAENASKDYTLPRVRTLIEFCIENKGWEFLYLGANIDAFSAASTMGIGKERTSQYHADPTGVSINFEVLSSTVSQLRRSRVIDDDWKDKIEVDFEKRGKTKT